MFLFPYGQMSQAWEFSKKATVFGNLGPLGVKVQSHFPVFRMLIAEVFYAVPSEFSVSLYTALRMK